MTKRIQSWLLLLVAVVFLLVGLGWLMRLRFESGEVYPRQSSLRVDPLGSKVLFESLDSLPEVEVLRNFEPLEQRKELPDEAVLMVLNTWGWQMHEWAGISLVKSFVEEGGRLIVGLNPEHVAFEHISNEDTEEDLSEDEPDQPHTREPEGEESDFWGALTLIHGEHEGGTAYLRDEAASSGLPGSVPWQEGGALENLGEKWTPIYEVEGEVVVVEGQLGAGSIVVLCDDYLFSNEAMLKHRFPQFLVWVLAGRKTVVFDETHLGVAERTGIATLLWRYRLDGFFIGLAVFMILLVWRGSSPLLPARRNEAPKNLVLTDHSSDAGLADLVRRSVSTDQLPLEAFRIWKKTFIRNPVDEQFYAGELKEAEEVLREYESLHSVKRHPLQTHLHIQSIINRKKRKRS